MFRFFGLFLPLLLIVWLSGCSGGKGDTNNQQIVLNGVVQKGPFINGKVNIYTKSGQLIGTGDINENGKYAVKLSQNYTKGLFIKAIGDSKNEINGNIEKNVELEGFIDKKTTQYNINLYTTLVAKRVKKLIQNGLDEDRANKQAREELYQKFNIPPTISLHKLNIQKVDGEYKLYNLNLLLVSAAFSKVSEENNKTIKQNLDKFSQDFAENGELDNDGLEDFSEIISTLNDKNETQELYTSIKSNLPTLPDIPEDIFNSVVIPAKVQIKEVNFKGVTLDNRYIAYKNQPVIYIGMDQNNSVNLHFDINYTKDGNATDTARVYLKVDRVKYKLPIVSDSPVYSFNSSNIKRTISVSLNQHIRDILKTLYRQNKGPVFVIYLGDNKRDIQLPKLFQNNKDFIHNIKLSSITYLGSCRNNEIKANLEGLLNGVEVTFNNSCLQIPQNGNETFELIEGNATVSKPVTFIYGNLDVNFTIDSINKTNIKISKIDISLPLKHSIHKKDLDLNRDC